MTAPATYAPDLSRPDRRPYLPALDGLRGLAIAGVLLFHTGHLPGGFLGVDLFFVLSGYLITDLLLREVCATGRVDLVAFWGRRARRLLPALAVVLVVVTAVVAWAAPRDVVRTALADGPWVQASLANWHLVAEDAGYWDRFGPGRVFGHLWSIAVEEQFYAVWPLVVLGLVAVLGRGRVHRGVAVVAVLLTAASAAHMALLVDPADPTRVYLGTDTRASALLLGALVATAPVRAVLARVPRRWALAGTLLALASAGLVWAAADGTGSAWLFRGGLLTHSAAAAVVVGCVAHAPVTGVTRALAWWPLRALGRASYSLYLWHWPVVVLVTPEATGLRGWALTGVVLAASIAFAVVSTRLVEDPIRFRARWARGRRGAVVLVAVMAALAALWLAVPDPGPPPVDAGKLADLSR